MATSLDNIVDMVFKECKDPFFFSIRLPINDLGELFNHILDIYKGGINKLYGKDGMINIYDLKQTHLDNMKNFMKSIGIEPFIKVFNKEELHYTYYGFMDSLKHPDILRHTVNDFNDDFIVDIKINIPDDPKCLAVFNKAVSNNKYIKYLIDLPKTQLSDFAFKINNNGIFYILFFDYATNHSNCNEKLKFL